MSLEALEKREIRAIDRICAEIKAKGALTGRARAKLLAYFARRLENAESLVQKGAVKKYVFQPSGREIWAVRGRGGEYQVIPDSNFCTCDDYYFRVMDREKQLCYHLIAQRLAETLHQFQVENLPDSRYSWVTRKWRASGTKGESSNED